MDFDLLYFIAGIASILSLGFYLWDKYKNKRGDKSNQDGSVTQNANIIINMGNNGSREIIESVLNRSQNTTNTQEQTSIPLQIDETVSDLLSKETAGQLKSMRRKWKEGHKSKVMQWLKGLRNDKWPLLSPEVKADVLLFQAGIELEEKRDIGRARELADEARTLMPSQNQIRIRAWIACHEEGPEEALSVLDNQKDIDSLNLRANFLLMLNRVEEALEVLNFEDESNGET